MWREVTATTVGLTGIVELFAKRVRREDHLALAKEMIEHADQLAERAGRQRGQVAAARLEGEAKGMAGGGRHAAGPARIGVGGDALAMDSVEHPFDTRSRRGSPSRN